MSAPRRPFARALVALLALPGTIGFLIPLLLGRARVGAGFNMFGVPLVSLGSLFLVWCVKEFYAAGKGTLAPWAPPTRLVTTGPYGLSRNPMYVAVSLILLGWAVGFRSAVLTVYAIAVMTAFHLRVVRAEEPELERTYGQEWIEYRSRVRRWL